MVAERCRKGKDTGNCEGVGDWEMKENMNRISKLCIFPADVNIWWETFTEMTDVPFYISSKLLQIPFQRALEKNPKFPLKSVQSLEDIVCKSVIILSAELPIIP